MRTDTSATVGSAPGWTGPVRSADEVLLGLENSRWVPGTRRHTAFLEA